MPFRCIFLVDVGGSNSNSSAISSERALGGGYIYSACTRFTIIILIA